MLKIYVALFCAVMMCLTGCGYQPQNTATSTDATTQVEQQKNQSDVKQTSNVDAPTTTIYSQQPTTTIAVTTAAAHVFSVPDLHLYLVDYYEKKQRVPSVDEAFFDMQQLYNMPHGLIDELDEFLKSTKDNLTIGDIIGSYKFRRDGHTIESLTTHFDISEPEAKRLLDSDLHTLAQICFLAEVSDDQIQHLNKTYFIDTKQNDIPLTEFTSLFTETYEAYQLYGDYINKGFMGDDITKIDKKDFTYLANDIDHDLSAYTDKYIYLQGKVYLHEKFDGKYEDLEDSYFSTIVIPESKDNTDKWYVYLQRDEFNDVFHRLQTESGLSVEIACLVPRYESINGSSLTYAPGDGNRAVAVSLSITD